LVRQLADGAWNIFPPTGYIFSKSGLIVKHGFDQEKGSNGFELSAMQWIGFSITLINMTYYEF